MRTGNPDFALWFRGRIVAVLGGQIVRGFMFAMRLIFSCLFAFLVMLALPCYRWDLFLVAIDFQIPPSRYQACLLADSQRSTGALDRNRM